MFWVLCVFGATLCMFGGHYMFCGFTLFRVTLCLGVTVLCVLGVHCVCVWEFTLYVFRGSLVCVWGVILSFLPPTSSCKVHLFPHMEPSMSVPPQLECPLFNTLPLWGRTPEFQNWTCLMNPVPGPGNKLALWEHSQFLSGISRP